MSTHAYLPTCTGKLGKQGKKENETETLTARDTEKLKSPNYLNRLTKIFKKKKKVFVNEPRASIMKIMNTGEIFFTRFNIFQYFQFWKSTLGTHLLLV